MRAVQTLVTELYRMGPMNRESMGMMEMHAHAVKRKSKKSLSRSAARIFVRTVNAALIVSVQQAN